MFRKKKIFAKKNAKIINVEGQGHFFKIKTGGQISSLKMGYSRALTLLYRIVPFEH